MYTFLTDFFVDNTDIKSKSFNSMGPSTVPIKSELFYFKFVEFFLGRKVYILFFTLK